MYAAGVTARQVYLPAGTWYDWHTRACFAGKQFVVAPTPMEHIPLYARGGAVLPLWPEVPPSTAGYYPTAIELQIFVPLADGEYTSTLVEDDGLSFGFRDGASYRTEFTLRRAGAQLTLHAAVAGDGYAEFAREMFWISVIGAEPAAVRQGDTALEAVAGRWNLPNAGAGFDLVIDLA